MDARDGLLDQEAYRKLREKVMKHDPALWDDFRWMKEHDQPGGVLHELAAMRDETPDQYTIARFHKRRETDRHAGAELEPLVWSWFRRYVLTAGIVFIIVLAGLQTGNHGVTEASGQQQLEIFLGWNEPLEMSHQEIPELDHWLYEDLD